MEDLEREARRLATNLKKQEIVPIALAASSGPCLFAVWVQREALAETRPVIPESPVRGEWSLLYVGAAPFSPTMATAKLDRVISNHARGSLASSSLRVSLAALLQEHLALQPIRRSRYAKLADERPLTEWIKAHCGVILIPVSKPWLLEAAVIRLLRPPLNIRKGSHPFLVEVDKARRQLLDACGLTRVAKEARVMNK